MTEKAIFAGGCFWCTEAVFQRINGVETVKQGYTAGTIKNPSYKEVCTGRTGHTEAIEIIFNDEIVSFRTLLEVFFATHDATTLNRQGNDVGTQYRSGIYFTSEKQKFQAKTFISVLNEKKVFENAIVTEVKPFDVFYDAEENHHDYYDQNKEQPYCQFVITPKVDKIRTFFADKLKTNY